MDWKKFWFWLNLTTVLLIGIGTFVMGFIIHLRYPTDGLRFWAIIGLSIISSLYLGGLISVGIACLFSKTRGAWVFCRDRSKHPVFWPWDTRGSLQVNRTMVHIGVNLFSHGDWDFGEGATGIAGLLAESPSGLSNAISVVVAFSMLLATQVIHKSSDLVSYTVIATTWYLVWGWAFTRAGQWVKEKAIRAARWLKNSLFIPLKRANKWLRTNVVEPVKRLFSKQDDAMRDEAPDE